MNLDKIELFLANHKKYIISMLPFSPNIIIKVPKKEEQEKREKIGNIYLHPSFVWMTRNTQCGVIVSISPDAQKEFPFAKVGDMLLCHHFVQASHSIKENEKRFLVYEDDTYFYYNVTAKEWNGQNNQSYAIYDGEKIIPHKDYVFLEKPLPQAKLKVEGIEIPDYKVTDEDIFAKLEIIKSDIMNLTKSRMTPDIKLAIQAKEREQSNLSKSIHEKKYLPYTLAYSNPSLGIENGTTVMCMNLAARTTLSFLDKEYLMCPVKYVAAIC